MDDNAIITKGRTIGRYSFINAYFGEGRTPN